MTELKLAAILTAISVYMEQEAAKTVKSRRESSTWKYHTQYEKAKSTMSGQTKRMITQHTQTREG